MEAFADGGSEILIDEAKAKLISMLPIFESKEVLGRFEKEYGAEDGLSEYKISYLPALEALKKSLSRDGK
jgi:hypothetical protein